MYCQIPTLWVVSIIAQNYQSQDNKMYIATYKYSQVLFKPSKQLANDKFQFYMDLHCKLRRLAYGKMPSPLNDAVAQTRFITLYNAL